MDDGSLPTTVKPPSPQSDPPERNPSAGSFLSTLSVAVVCWLLIGTISYSPAARASVGDGFILLSVLLVPAQLVLLTLAGAAARGLWPRRTSAIFTAGTAGFGAAILFAIWAAESWAHWGQGLFWALGGVYGGVALEVATGFWSWLGRRLERSAGRG
ncbi:hypothetical protein CT0861_08587 [Colletotrichum tofieldiae]|uniref:Uncharacterized protein n=1 Tax=Colletotrichum tofieldiae TaxID=708197 RepID=A0A161Y8H8_9PEZI|nr:hypothetical protein CT0861_08587 [Colletotrichum tofieldiae]